MSDPMDNAPKDCEILVWDGGRWDIVKWVTTAGGWSGWQCIARDEWACQDGDLLRVESPERWMPLPDIPGAANCTEGAQMSGLLPCPFCGGTDLDARGDNAIFCNKVGCEAGIDMGHTVGPGARQDVIRRWNTRWVVVTDPFGRILPDVRTRSVKP